MTPLPTVPLCDLDAYCDKHPNMRMAKSQIEDQQQRVNSQPPRVSLLGTVLEVLGCPVCDRKFRPDLGYFDAPDGVPLRPVVGDNEPRCHKHDRAMDPAMYVDSSTDLTLQYRCPARGCQNRTVVDRKR